MSRASGPWICIALVGIAFILLSSSAPFLPSLPPGGRSSFGGRGGGFGGRGGRYGTNRTQQQQQGRTPFPLKGGGGRGMFPFFPQPQPQQQNPPPQTSNIDVADPLLSPLLLPSSSFLSSCPNISSSSSSSSTGASSYLPEADEVPAVLLVSLYSSIALSLVVLLLYRIYVHCTSSAAFPYSALPDDAVLDAEDVISPLSLYSYQMMTPLPPLPVTDTPQSSTSSPLSSSMPPLPTSYVSTDEEEDGHQRRSQQCAYSV